MPASRSCGARNPCHSPVRSSRSPRTPIRHPFRTAEIARAADAANASMAKTADLDALQKQARYAAMTLSDRQLMQDPVPAAAAAYREAIVTFVDILGFRSLVRDKPAS